MKAPAPVQTAALAGALFVYLTAEMFPIGVLPELAAELHTTESGAGRLLTVYAVIAGIAIVPTVMVTRHLDRRVVLVGALIVLAVSQAALAAAPNAPSALAARAVAAVPHGLLWSTVPIVAVSLAPDDRQGRATAHVFVGGSAALVGGAPLMTGLSSWIGWRPAALALAVLALLIGALLWVILPTMPPIGTATRQKTPMPTRGVAGVCVVTVLVVTASYVPYTFFSVLAQPYGFRSWSLGGLQIGFGVAGMFAVAVIGRQIDRSVASALMVTVTGLVVAFGVIALEPPTALFVIGIVVWGAALACVAPTMQSAALRSTPGDKAMASALYVLAFQIGISAGSLLGGVVLDGPGPRWLMVCALAGLAPVVTALALQRLTVRSNAPRVSQSPRGRRRRA